MPATHSLQNPRYRGIFPVVPTTFHEDGTLDLDSQKRCLDFMKGFTNFHSSGRQVLFQYGNMDHSLAMGLVLGEKLLRGEGVDHDKLLEEEESVDG